MFVTVFVKRPLLDLSIARSPIAHYFSKMYFNIIFLAKFRCSKLSVSLMLSNKYLVPIIYPVRDRLGNSLFECSWKVSFFSTMSDYNK
jgi:hypothetical protein